MSAELLVVSEAVAAVLGNEVGSFEGTTRGGHITGLGVGFCPIFGVVLLGTESRFFLFQSQVGW
jgi:hypothetical protein